MKAKILILMIVILASGCNNSLAQPVKDNKENENMDNSEKIMHPLFKQCQDTNPKSIETVFQNLNDPAGLGQLDARSVYDEASNPPGLLKLLQCLAANPNQAAVVPDWGKLIDSPLYARSDPQGTLRRNVLIIASGNLIQLDKKVLAFLESEVLKDGEKRSIAVHALSKIGTPDSLTILSMHIFNPKTCVIPAHLRDIYLPNYTMELAEFRDRPAVLSLLLDKLYPTDLRTKVLACLMYDRLERSPEHKYHIIAAPLNEKTKNSVTLAKMIAVWFTKNSQDFQGDEFTPIAKRIPDLLGIPYATRPASQESLVVKQWVKSVFEQAWKQTEDSDRKQQIQQAMAAL